MGRKEPSIDPNRWSASQLRDAIECGERLRRKLEGEKPPEPPIFVAGSAVHGAARFAVKHRGFRRTAERPIFFKSAESFLKWWWTYWSQTVKKKEEDRGIHWKEGEEDRQFASWGTFCGELLTGYRWLGPEAPRQLIKVRRGYFQMMVNPSIPFRLLAAEKRFNVQFDQFQLVGRIDQIWKVEPCPAFKKGRVVLVDLTLGGGPEKYIQLVFYSLAVRLAALQNPRFREEIFGVPRNQRLSEEEKVALLREEAVAVLPLAEAKLKVRRPCKEDYKELREKLEEADATVRRIMRGEKVSAKPTDAVCNRCIFNFDCRYAATREFVDLTTGEYEVLPSPVEAPSPDGQKAFPGWKQGPQVKVPVERKPLARVPTVLVGEE